MEPFHGNIAGIFQPASVCTRPSRPSCWGVAKSVSPRRGRIGTPRAGPGLGALLVEQFGGVDLVGARELVVPFVDDGLAVVAPLGGRAEEHGHPPGLLGGLADVEPPAQGLGRADPERPHGGVAAAHELVHLGDGQPGGAQVGARGPGDVEVLGVDARHHLVAAGARLPGRLGLVQCEQFAAGPFGHEDLIGGFGLRGHRRRPVVSAVGQGVGREVGHEPESGRGRCGGDAVLLQVGRGGVRAGLGGGVAERARGRAGLVHIAGRAAGLGGRFGLGGGIWH
nr:hypothetical protein GCM10025732_10130 [Glycomyces mayteni]